MSKKNWTDKQEAFLIIKKEEGYTAKEIAKKLNRKYGTRRTDTQVDAKLYHLKKKGKLNQSSKVLREKYNIPNYSKYSQEEIDFIHGCFRNNFSRYMIMKGFEEQFGKEILDSQIYYVIKKKKPTNSIALEEKVIEEEIAKKAESIPLTWHREAFSKALNSPEKKPKKESRTRHHWTDEEEFNLLCNFYELSIDEARKEFQRPFYAIAKRLEMIIDSTKPKHIDMLMEASKVIKERKKVREKAAKTGFLKRRKVRRQAKKMAKLEKKLSKMKGE
tara:strand:- start:3198 stop:4019 length:822 start_codon:yes stop_codon:yes gene_type:complete